MKVVNSIGVWTINNEILKELEKDCEVLWNNNNLKVLKLKSDNIVYIVSEIIKDVFGVTKVMV